MKKAVVLINLGTPDAPHYRAVYRYLTEFLTDPRVIDKPWLLRQLLVRALIVPARCHSSAAAYKAIWGREGSPLLSYSESQRKLLQNALGEEYTVFLAMRYRYPSIPDLFHSLEKESWRHLIILPLFPQYASATTGSVYQCVMGQLEKWNLFPTITFISHYALEPLLIEAYAEQIEKCSLSDYDHLLFSFHGLPESQVRKVDKRGHCLKNNCCQHLCDANSNCYSAQCYAMAHAIAARLKLAQGQYSLCFQSRLGREPWLRPYIGDTLHSLLKQGVRRLLVASPSFVSDCLETLYEIGIECRHDFLRGGGEELRLVPSLNDAPAGIAALQQLVQTRR